MPVIINIETSTTVCSVSVSDNENIIFNKIDIEGPSHAALLGVFVDEAVKFLRSQHLTADAVAVSCGPGSYTGLRIGVSEAKGVCFGMDIPLIAINTPLIMASGVVGNVDLPEEVLLCPMIDARRMEVYAAIYDQRLNVVRDIQADIVDEHSYEALLEKNKVVFFGNGADKCKNKLTSENALFLENIYPQATDMVTLSNKAYHKKNFVDVAYFEPFYLKEFVATTPKKKIIG